MAIVRSEDEIMECRDLARKLTDKAEEQDLRDPAADAIYEFIQWLYGWTDAHPREGYLEDDEYEDES